MSKLEFTISLSNDIQKLFPAFRACFVLVPDVSDYHEDNEKKQFADKIVSEVFSKFPTQESLDNHYLKDGYISFYDRMGINPKKVSTPIHQVGRVLKNGVYKNIHKIIDTCMLIEYTTLVSFQVYDAEKIQRELAYELASGTEALTDFHGNVQHCRVGELILSDNKGVIHSVYHGNDVSRLIGKSSSNCLVRIMGIPDLHEDDFAHASHSFTRFYPQSSSLVLSNQTPSGVLKES